MIRKLLVSLLIAAQLFGSFAHAALADYVGDVSFAWYADSVADSDIPTGSTKTNPSGLSDPSLVGTPDSYADFTLTNGVIFTTPAPTGEVGLGDITIVAKLQLDTSTAGRVIAENFDGTGTVDTATGWQISNTTGTSRRIGLAALPTEAASEKIETASDSHALGAPFIIAFRRVSGVWTVWVDADASGGMVTNTPGTNNLGTDDVFSETGDVTFGSRRTAANPFDGRVYWLVQIDTGVSDSDIQLADWDNEATIKAAFSGSPPAGNLLLRRRRAANDDHIEQQPLRAVGF